MQDPWELLGANIGKKQFADVFLIYYFVVKIYTFLLVSRDVLATNGQQSESRFRVFKWKLFRFQIQNITSQ